MTVAAQSTRLWTAAILSPAAHFSLNTGNQSLDYTFDVNTGFQDLTATGRSLINIDTNINILGFYDQTFQISNRGEFNTDGLGPAFSKTLDYDIGPINVSGNIFADALAAFTQPFFTSQGQENPFAKFSSRATKVAGLQKSIDDLQACAKAGEILSDDEIAQLINNTIMASMLGNKKPSLNMLGRLPLPKSMLEPEHALAVTRSIDLEISGIPEPTTLILLTIGVLIVQPLRRRRNTCSPSARG